MSLWKVAWRSIQQRLFVSALTVLSMGLGVALVVAVLVVYGVVSQSFHRGGEGYDLIVGAKGGREQLVLNTVFYLSQPVGNIPYSYFEELTIGKFAPAVEAAIPVCMGHNYQGFRVVGTVPEMFTELKYRGDKSYEFAAGKNFQVENHFEGVLGSVAAARTKLHVGEPFKAVHGSGIGGHTHKQPFTVVGILKPTGTPVDRAVFVNMYGFHDIHRAEAIISGDREGNADHDRIKEITAALVCTNSAAETDVIKRAINRDKVAQAVSPVRVIADLFEGIVGKLQWILLGMGILTTVVAGIGIMVSIYNSMSDRRHEIAVMRALGASRTTVMLVIMMESVLLALMGGALGLLIGHGAIWLCSPWIAEQTGVIVGLLQFQLIELILVPGLIILAAAVGYLPAMAAYRTDVSQSLITTP
ncbi:MAG: ABC transporter permease [Pirellulales bacterium]|nr:ABC transporter permease [Pirellulales bacterium]